MVKTILNKDTGEVLFSTDGNYDCLKNEVVAPFNPTEFLIKGFFHFKNQKYFETSTEIVVEIEPTKESLKETMQSLEEKINEVKLKINKLK
jgi:hypothetical protein